MSVKVSVKDTAPCAKTLSIAVSGDKIQAEYDEFYDHAGREARIPGFRPGKAPQEVVRVRYREEAKEKVLERLIARSFREAVGEKQIEFLGRPTIQDIRFTEDRLSYEALVEVAPRIRLGRYRGLACERAVVAVKPEEVNEALEKVRESVAKFVAVEDRPAALGDFLIADYRCQVDGLEVENRTDDWFELRKEEFLKGFSEQLAGVRGGDEREVRIRFPENFGRKEWSNKEGVFRVKVKEIKTKQLPALDDELAKETGEFTTLAELRAQLEKKIEADKSRKAEIEFEGKLMEALLKENTFEVPAGVVERRLTSLLQTAAETLMRQGMAQEMIEKEMPSLREKMRPEAEREVRLSFLLDEIAKREKLELLEIDFETKYRETAARHRQKEDPVRQYYNEHPEAKEALGIQILNEKVIQLVKDNVK